MIKKLCWFLLFIAILPFSTHAAPLCDKLGFAGLLASCNRGEPIELTLASGKPLGKDRVLQSGAYYKMYITADGSAELAISGASFFRAVWINEIVINQIEIRPMAVDSLEFDADNNGSTLFHYSSRSSIRFTLLNPLINKLIHFRLYYFNC